MKKEVRLSLLLAAVFTLLPTGVFAEEPNGNLDQFISFKDVPENAWYAKPISDACLYGLFNGVGGDCFAPQSKITRADFVTVLGRLYEQSGVIIIDSADTFNDTKKNSYYSKYITWASDANMIQGYGNGDFGPADPTTKEQMAVILSRYISYTEQSLKADPGDMYFEFKDLDAISGWAGPAVAELEQYAIVQGDERGYFHPQKYASRAEAATVFARFYDLIYEPEMIVD